MRINKMKRILISLLFACFTGFLFLTMNMTISTVRNGEEYTESLVDGDVYVQELVLENTPRIYVSVLPLYNTPSSKVGIDYEIVAEGQAITGFIPLVELTNREWTTLIIPTPNTLYAGTAHIMLKAVGFDSENTLQFLITTNTLQTDPDCQLIKNGDQIVNGRLVMSYKKFDISTASELMFITFIVVCVISRFSGRISKSIKKYPFAYITAAIFLGNVIAQYPSLYDINKHVSAQYLYNWQTLGFVRRALAGTVIKFFNIDLTSERYVIYGIICIGLMLILEIYIIYHRSNLHYNIQLEKCFAAFLCMPFAVTTFFGFHFFARLDELLIICFLLCCIAIIKERGLIFIPIISVVAILIHEMFVAIFVPFVFCLLLYKFYLTQNRKYLIILICTSIFSVFFGVFVGFIAKTDTPYELAWETMSNNPLAFDYPLRINYYSSSMYAFTESWNTLFSSNAIPAAVLSLFLLLPVILLAIFWLKQYHSRQSNLLGRLIVLLFPCTIAGTVLCMYMMCDWGRLFVMYGLGVFFSFVTLWFMDEKRVATSVVAVWQKVTSKIGVAAVWGICLFYLFISTVQQGSSSTTLFEFVRTLFNN